MSRNVKLLSKNDISYTNSLETFAVLHAPGWNPRPYQTTSLLRWLSRDIPIQSKLDLNVLKHTIIYSRWHPPLGPALLPAVHHGTAPTRCGGGDPRLPARTSSHTGTPVLASLAFFHPDAVHPRLVEHTHRRSRPGYIISTTKRTTYSFNPGYKTILLSRVPIRSVQS